MGSNKVQETPSWPQCEEAKAAYLDAQATSGKSSFEAQEARELYAQAMKVCTDEAGITAPGW